MSQTNTDERQGQKTEGGNDTYEYDPAERLICEWCPMSRNSDELKDQTSHQEWVGWVLARTGELIRSHNRGACLVFISTLLLVGSTILNLFF